MTDRETAQLEPNQNPIMVVAMIKSVKLFIKPISGRIKIQPEIINTRVRLCPKRSAIIPDTSPPIPEVTRIPNKMYVFIVSDTPHTCSKKIGKLFDAVRMASLKRKYASRKSAIPGNRKSLFVSDTKFFHSDFNWNRFFSFSGSLNQINMGKARSVKAITAGNKVSARASESNKLIEPLENGRTISRPVN